MELVPYNVNNEDSNEIVCASIYLRLRSVTVETESYRITGDNTISLKRPPYPSGEFHSINIGNVQMEKKFTFSAIFDTEATQRDLYEQCILKKIEKGESLTILSMGTPISGKTHTLLGNSASPGILPRSLVNIFTSYRENISAKAFLKPLKAYVCMQSDDSTDAEEIFREKIFNGIDRMTMEQEEQLQIVEDEHEFTPITEEKDFLIFVWVSFVEIYNESVNDLLAPPKNWTPSLRSQDLPSTARLQVLGKKGKMYIDEVTNIYVKNSEEALQLLHYGRQHITCGVPLPDGNSCLAHCVFCVNIYKYYDDGRVSQISYKFVELAAEQNLSSTENSLSFRNEKKLVNSSLKTLRQCLEIAKENNEEFPMPYCNSNLTMIIQAALLGKEKLAIIAHISPLDDHYKDNIKLIKFARIAKSITYKPTIRHGKNRFLFSPMYEMVNDDTDDNNPAFLELRVAYGRKEKLHLISIKKEVAMFYRKQLRRQKTQLRRDLRNDVQKLVDKAKIENADFMQEAIAQHNRQIKTPTKKQKSSLLNICVLS